MIVLLWFLMSSMPKLGLNDSGLFLLGMRRIVLAGVSMISMGNIPFLMISYSMKVPLVVWVFLGLYPPWMSLLPHLVLFVLLVIVPMFILQWVRLMMRYCAFRPLGILCMITLVLWQLGVQMGVLLHPCSLCRSWIVVLWICHLPFLFLMCFTP